MKSEFYKAYKYIIKKIIKSNGIENLKCKEKRKLLKLLNENPILVKEDTDYIFGFLRNIEFLDELSLKAISSEYLNL